MGAVLPAKDEKRFREVLRLYESKLYKKGLKAADKLLKDYPTHAGTLSLKGLILANERHPERCDEAHQLCREALRLDIKSHMSWHIFGLLHKLERNYKEAIKCYATAMRINPDNQQVVRDLSLLQIQDRDLDGFLATRQAMLNARANVNVHWVGVAVAHHLCGNHDMALQVLDLYKSVTSDAKEGAEDEAFEASETVLYRAQVLEESGKVTEALQLLTDSDAVIVDRLGLQETRASLLLQKGDAAAAADTYRQLLDLNPENYRYHEGLRAALGQQGDGASTSGLTDLYRELQKAHPRSNACRRIPLDFLSGAEFESAAAEYAGPYLDRGIPSLFVALRPLYEDRAKAEALGRLARGWVDGSTGERRVWAQLFLAQHLAHVGDPEGALAVLGEAVAAAPGTIELRSCRADVLAAVGDKHGAVSEADAAREMDLQDRYLNCAAVKHMFAAGEVERGEAVAGLFTKEGNGLNNLYAMQATWYETSCGRGHLSRGEFGLALKKLMSVFKHFSDYIEDQYDFHTYCLRKMTLRAYVDMLRMVDGIYGQGEFHEAARVACGALVEVADRPELRRSPEEVEEAKLAGMSKAERKEYRKAKAEEEEQRRRNKPGHGPAPWGPRDKADEDPDGQRWLHAHDPLEEAAVLVDRMRQFCRDRIGTHVAAFEVHLRRGKRLLALQAVREAVRVGGEGCVEVVAMAARLAVHVRGGAAGAAVANGGEGDGRGAAVEAVLVEGVAALVGADAGAYVQAWGAKHGEASVEHAARLAEARVVTGTPVAEAVRPLLDPKWLAQCGDADVGRFEALHRDLTLGTSRLHCPEAAEEFWKQCQKRFRRSTYFGGELAAPRQPWTRGGAGGKADVADKMAGLALSGSKGS